MKYLLAALLLTVSMHSHAYFTCINDDQTVVHWKAGQYFSGVGYSPIYCVADGAELAYIDQMFTGLRGRKGSSTMGRTEVIWFGDDAEFIVNNL